MPWPLDGQWRKLRWLQCPQMFAHGQKRAEEPAESALPKSFQSTKKNRNRKSILEETKQKDSSQFLLRHSIPSRKRNKWCRWRRQRPLDEQMARLNLLDRRFVDDGITRHHQLRNWDEKQNPYLRKRRFVGNVRRCDG